MKLPEGLTVKHIEDAVNRNDHQMVYHGAVINIDELWKMIKEEATKEQERGELKIDSIRPQRIRRIQEQSEESI